MKLLTAPLKGAFMLHFRGKCPVKAWFDFVWTPEYNWDTKRGLNSLNQWKAAYRGLVSLLF